MSQSDDLITDDAVGRRYPSRPVVAVSGVVIVSAGVLLVRRRNPPLAHHWSLPGGVLNLGESLHNGLVRELREETGLVVAPGPLVDVVEHIDRDEDGRVSYHYVIADYLCRVLDGTPTAAEDAADVVAAAPEDLDRYWLTPRTRAVIARAYQMRGNEGHRGDGAPEAPEGPTLGR